MNKVIMVGRIASEIEVKSTTKGDVAQFRIAVSRGYVGQDGKREADFFSCVAWQHRARYLQQYGGKGDMLAVEGELRARSYTAQDGGTRYVTEILCDSVELCGGRRNAGQAEGVAGQAAAAQAEGSRAQQERMQFTGNVNQHGEREVIDDDLPF